MRIRLTRKQLAIIMSLLVTCPLTAVPAMAMESTAPEAAVAPEDEVTGVILDQDGYPLPGAKVQVKGTGVVAITDVNGKFKIKLGGRTGQLAVSYIGFKSATRSVTAGGKVSITLSEDTKQMDQVVVTAMGIQRKEKSLTYATQSIKAEDLQKVPSIDATTGLEGKISGLTVTPSAGGAGGASKILLRGNQSIMGNNEPLIVIDGVPMNNSKHGQVTDATTIDQGNSAEGGDALSLINPDDIESINFLKGANAAALYGSQAANGVVMITTKSGRVGKLDISYTTNVTAEMAMSTPNIQRMYGAAVTDNGDGTNSLAVSAWGPAISQGPAGAVAIGLDSKFQTDDRTAKGVTTRDIYLRNTSKDNLSEFYRTGTTVNNSVSLSGGTEKIRTYVSLANSHAVGIVQNNSYNRNTVNLRQSYTLWDRKDKKWFRNGRAEIALNYVESRTNNRVGGGTTMNPIYHLYMTPNNVDMTYYKKNYLASDQWNSYSQSIFVPNSSGSYDLTTGSAVYSSDEAQNWAYQAARLNNPYYLLNQNTSQVKEMRVYGHGQFNMDIYDGLSVQVRYSLNKYKYNTEGCRYATTWNLANMYDYGTYYKNANTSTEQYVDALLSYNKVFKKDWSVSATLGYVGHTIKGDNYGTYLANATWVDGNRLKYNQGVNIFNVNAGSSGNTSSSLTSQWDQAAIFTAQLGWKETVYIDGSYREDWYRAFKQFAKRGTPDHYGYFGIGASAIVSNLVKLPEWFNYLKARLSYSEVGNSIPNQVYSSSTTNGISGTATVSNYVIADPRPETTKSVEAGLEMLFLDNCLSLDLTYYNSALHNMYLVTGSSAGKSIVSNSGLVRNQGIEMTIGYNFKFGKDWRWKTSLNYSYNHNKIEKTAYDDQGVEKKLSITIANCVQVPYREGTSYGDMYVTDFRRYTEKQAEALGHPEWAGLIKVNTDGSVQQDVSNTYGRYVGNMYSPHQIGWSNQISWKNFSLSFLINGRIGGHMIDLTEAYLDQYGLSQRTADARALSDKMGWTAQYGQAMMHVPGAPQDQLYPVEGYYTSIGSQKIASEYCYSSTNIRLRELTFGYMFRDLIGAGKHLTLSFVARNLFFFYKDAPSDPDVSLSTANSLGGVACFNFPSTRTLGFSAKVNF